MKTNLFKAVLINRSKETEAPYKETIIYVAADDIFEAAKKLHIVLAVEEELKDIQKISEECYV